MSMTDADAAFLLALAAENDNRTYNKSTEQNWARLLSNLDVADCADAIERYYLDPVAKPITPGIIRDIIRVLRREAAERQHTEDLRAELPEFDGILNRYGRALVLAAAAEHKASREAAARGEVLLPSTPIREMLDRHGPDRADQSQPEYSVREMVRRLQIPVPAPVAPGTEMADVFRHLLPPEPDPNSPEEKRYQAAVSRAQAEKAARHSPA